MDSPEFGLVTFVAIGTTHNRSSFIDYCYCMIIFFKKGATMVGSVRLTVPAGRTLNKGDELGYFGIQLRSFIIIHHHHPLPINYSSLFLSLFWGGGEASFI